MIGQVEGAKVPKLRFREFLGEWTVSRLQELSSAEISYGVVKPGERDSEGVAFIRGGDFPEGIINPSKLRTISKELSQQYRRTKLLGGELVVSLVGYPGACAIVPEQLGGANVARQVAVVRPKKTTNLSFVYQYLIGPNGQGQLLSKVVGSAQQVINLVDLRKLQIPHANPIEQQKIADFLGAVDARVGLLRRRRDALRTYKKGMMQRLFAQTLRFTKADGSAFPDWQEKRLGEVSETVTGSSNREDSTERGDYVFFDRSSDVRASARFLFDCEAIIVAGEGKDFPPRHFVGKFDLHQRTYATMNFGKNSGKFLFYWIDWHRAHFLKNAVGSTMPSLRMASFSHFAVSIPHPEEQQKIANFLSALDAKINAVTAKVDAMLTLKKGLQQKMFV